MTEQLRPWDPAQQLETEADLLLYLQLAMEDPFPEFIAAILDDVARAKSAAHFSEASFNDARLRQAVQDAARLLPGAAAV